MQNGWTFSELKEIVLALLALIWGILFLFPDEILSQASRINLLSYYAGDHTWGTLLILSGLILLLSHRYPHFYLQCLAHIFLWLFWLAIGLLVTVRGAENGWQATDLLLSTPYIAIAFTHGIFYMRLVYVR